MVHFRFHLSTLFRTASLCAFLLTLHREYDGDSHRTGVDGRVLGLARKVGLVVPRRRTDLDLARHALAVLVLDGAVLFGVGAGICKGFK
jgi:hypothetical protein